MLVVVCVSGIAVVVVIIAAVAASVAAASSSAVLALLCERDDIASGLQAVSLALAHTMLLNDIGAESDKALICRSVSMCVCAYNEI